MPARLHRNWPRYPVWHLRTSATDVFTSSRQVRTCSVERDRNLACSQRLRGRHRRHREMRGRVRQSVTPCDYFFRDELRVTRNAHEAARTPGVKPWQSYDEDAVDRRDPALVRWITRAI